MSKRTKIIIAILALVLLLVIGYYLFKKPAIVPGTAAASISPVTTKPQPVVNDNFPFDVGSQGPNVKRLQNALNLIRPENKIVEDGVFGSNTRIKLLTTVDTTMSQLPMTKVNFDRIIHLAVS